MSKVYFLVCFEKNRAVAIGEDVGPESKPYVWPDCIPSMNKFLFETRGFPIYAMHEEDERFREAEEDDSFDVDMAGIE